MPSFALSAIGKDRPGIVAAIAKVLYEQGCNVEDSSMTLLRGNFSVMLVLAAPDGTTAAGLDSALSGACEELGLLASVSEVDDSAVHPHPTHTLSVYGADKPGIVYRVTDALASLGANVTDLSARLVGEDGEPVYVLLLELSVPDGIDAAGPLGAIAREMGVDVSLNAVDDDVL